MTEYLSMDNIRTIVSILAFIIAGIIIYQLLKRGLKLLVEKQFIPEDLRIYLKIFVKWFIVFVVILLSIQVTGIGITQVWTALSAILVLIAIGFVAVWSILSNILCAVLLIIFAPFRIGDEVELTEINGDRLGGKVISINILFTTLKKMDEENLGKMIQIPNNLFFQKIIQRSRGTVTKSLKEDLFTKHEENGDVNGS